MYFLGLLFFNCLLIANIYRKLGKWRVWKNNHNGGVAQHIRNHLTKEHRFAYLAMCERINYIPPNVSALKSPDNNVNEPLTAEGILRYLTEWFAEDDIVSSILDPINGG
jgi:hypothetical protein